MNIRIIPRILPLLLCLLCANKIFAHGSVVAGGDLCVIKIGFYTAHFKIFQPQTSRNKEFCEDLPATGESIFVMEYLHQFLGEVPIEFRIIKNETGLGRFTRLADVESISDLDAVTVFHRKPVIEKDVYTIRYAFETDGDYLGLVMAKHPQTEEQYMAVFPFHVGKVNWGWAPIFLALAALAQLGYWFANGKLKRWYKNIMAVVPLALLLGALPQVGKAQDLHVSDKGLFAASMHSEVEPIPLNQIHRWVLHLQTADGADVAEAELTMKGGMPEHNHGLPTDPLISKYLGAGNYQVEGVRFHMQGNWELYLSIHSKGQSDTLTIVVKL